MADYDNDGSGGSGNGFMMGLLAGTVIGAGLGMLLAPKAGSELRGAIGDQAKNLGSKASEQYRRAADSASGWAEKGKEFVSQAREAVSRGVEETRGYASGSTAGSSTGTSAFGTDRGPTSGNFSQS